MSEVMARGVGLGGAGRRAGHRTDTAHTRLAGPNRSGRTRWSLQGTIYSSYLLIGSELGQSKALKHQVKIWKT